MSTNITNVNAGDIIEITGTRYYVSERLLIGMGNKLYMKLLGGEGYFFETVVPIDTKIKVTLM